jgi:hypothetical protein
VITLKVDFVLNNCVGYRAAAMHASGKYLCAIDENYAVHDFCMDSACALWGREPSSGGESKWSVAVLDDFAYVTHANSGDVSIYSIHALMHGQ